MRPSRFGIDSLLEIQSYDALAAGCAARRMSSPNIDKTSRLRVPRVQTKSHTGCETRDIEDSMNTKTPRNVLLVLTSRETHEKTGTSTGCWLEELALIGPSPTPAARSRSPRFEAAALPSIR
jgi:hypothetical protein